jgi:hemin uptake protein HemP
MGQNNQKSEACAYMPIITSQEKTYTSSDLLGSSSSVIIDHRGIIYTLRLTQFGKLILTK